MIDHANESLKNSRFIVVFSVKSIRSPKSYPCYALVATSIFTFNIVTLKAGSSNPIRFLMDDFQNYFLIFKNGSSILPLQFTRPTAFGWHGIHLFVLETNPFCKSSASCRCSEKLCHVLDLETCLEIALCQNTIFRFSLLLPTYTLTK